MIFRELERKQSIPLQLLISLGMKHLSLDSSKLGQRDEDCKEILDLAKAWYNVLEIESRTTFPEEDPAFENECYFFDAFAF